MFVAKTIPAEHRDLIHDVAYDFHGRRMATCSSDQFVKVGGAAGLGYVVLWTTGFTPHESRPELFRRLRAYFPERGGTANSVEWVFDIMVSPAFVDK